MSHMYQTQLPNGLTVVGEAIPGVQSLAMTLLTPAGIASQPADRQGVAPVLAEMLYRGAGDRDARQHSDALDLLGVQRSVSPSTRFFRIGATMISQKCAEALPLLLDMVRRPQLRDDSLAPSVDLSIQSIDALADEPQRRAMLELRQRHYPDPLGRSPLGMREHLEALTLADVRDFWSRRFVADGSILAFAGQFDWDALVTQVTDLLGDWTGQADPAGSTDDGDGGTHHLPADSAQVHIALAYPRPPRSTPTVSCSRRQPPSFPAACRADCSPRSAKNAGWFTPSPPATPAKRTAATSWPTPAPPPPGPRKPSTS